MTRPTDPADLTLTEAAAALQARSLSARALTQAVLTRIDQAQPTVQAYLRHDPARALRLADAADARAQSNQRKGPLDGVPYTVKDNVHTADFITTAGSGVPQRHDPGQTATLVRRLEAQGAILIGKANTWEYGTGTGHVRFDLPAPPARNPWNTAHFTGGSSTGSAAAVAAGMATFAIGTDSGGSVRLPAAACGVVGFKPTFGRISRAGIMPNTWAFDTPGPICASVADAALLYDLLAGADPDDPVSLSCAHAPTLPDLGGGIDGLRVGIVRNLDGPNGPPAPEIIAALTLAADLLRAAGATLHDVTLPVAPSEFRKVAAPINWSESFSIHERDYLDHRDLMGRALREKLETGMYMRAVDYLAALRARRTLVAATDTVFRDIDVLLLPMTYTTAPQITDTEAVRDFTAGSAGSPFSLTGHPAISLPAGFTATGLPVAVQLAAGFLDETALLRAAHMLEAALAMPGRAPLHQMTGVPA